MLKAQGIDSDVRTGRNAPDMFTAGEQFPVGLCKKRRVVNYKGKAASGPNQGLTAGNSGIGLANFAQCFEREPDALAHGGGTVCHCVLQLICPALDGNSVPGGGLAVPPLKTAKGRLERIRVGSVLRRALAFCVFQSFGQQRGILREVMKQANASSIKG